MGAPAVLELLGRYKSHEDARRADTDLLTRYIKAQTKNDELQDWTIRLVSSGLTEAAEKTIRGLDVGLVRRAPFPEEQRRDRYTIRRLVSPSDEEKDLTGEERAAAIARTVENWLNDKRPSKAKEQPASPGGKEIRQCRSKSRGMLLIYPLDPQPLIKPANNEIPPLPGDVSPVIGIAVSFPKSDTATEVTYTVNNVFTSRGGDDDSS